MPSNRKREKRRRRATDERKRRNMAVTNAREYEARMQQPREVELTPEITVEMRGNITDAELIATGLMPDDAYIRSNRPQNDPEIIRKSQIAAVHQSDAKLTVGITNPGYVPVRRGPEDEGKWTRASLPEAARAAALAWLDGGYAALKRVREQYESEESVRAQPALRGATERPAGADTDVRGGGSPVPGLRPVGDLHRPAVGDGGNGEEPHGYGQQYQQR